MKKIIILIGVISFLAISGLFIAACDPNDDNGDEDSSKGEQTVDPRPESPEPMSSKTAMLYFNDEGITLGINIGNTLEAVQNWAPYSPQNPKAIETAWGNPKINQAYFTGLEQLGFNIIRIPVSWMGHIGPAPDYIIDEAHLRRVAEVVNYAREAELKAFINVHHDGNQSHGWEGWLDINKVVAGDTSITDKFEKIWIQIAEYFKDYGDYLMFQGFNEIHRGDWGYNATPQEYNVINDWNQKFTNAVRSTGGNNTYRYLLYYGYMTSNHIASAHYDTFKLPTDTSAGRQIVGFHFYHPFSFSHDGTTHSWNTATGALDFNGWGGGWNEQAITEVFNNFKTKFVNNGIPVIIGENGPARYVPYNGNTGYNATNVTTAQQSRLLYIDCLYGKARENGIIPFYWEFGASYITQPNPEFPDFCLINRNNGQPNSQESRTVIERMVSAVNNATPPTPPIGDVTYNLGTTYTWTHENSVRGWEITPEIRAKIADGSIKYFVIGLNAASISTAGGLNGIGMIFNASNFSYSQHDKAFPWFHAEGKTEYNSAWNGWIPYADLIGTYGAGVVDGVVYLQYDLRQHPNYNPFRTAVPSATWAQFGMYVHEAWDGKTWHSVSTAFFKE